MAELGAREAQRLVEPLHSQLIQPIEILKPVPPRVPVPPRQSQPAAPSESLPHDTPPTPLTVVDFDRSTGLPPLYHIPRDTQTAALVRPANQLGPLGQVPNLSPTADPDWIWPGRIRRGELTLLAGDLGSGKSFVACDLAARLSSGRPLPDAALPGAVPACDSPADNSPADNSPADNSVASLSPTATPAPPLDVLLVVGLESQPQVLEKRLHQLQADSARVHVLRFVQDQTDSQQALGRNFAADRDLGLLAQQLLTNPGIQLIILDSFDRLVGTRHSPAIIRQVLTRLQALAATSGVAILITKNYAHAPRPGRHLRALGSTVFADCLRSIWAIERPTAAEVADERLTRPHAVAPPTHRLVPLKLNDFERSTRLDFTLRDDRVEWLGSPHDCPTEHQGYDPAQARRHAERSVLQEACDFLRALLAAGPVASAVVRQHADRAGLSWRTLQRAKGPLGIASSMTQEGGDHRWNWWLPGTPTVRPPEQAIPDLKPARPGSPPAQRAQPVADFTLHPLPPHRRERFRAFVDISAGQGPDSQETAISFQPIRQPGVPDMTESEIIAELAKLSIRVGTPPPLPPGGTPCWKLLRGVDHVADATSATAHVPPVMDRGTPSSREIPTTVRNAMATPTTGGWQQPGSGSWRHHDPTPLSALLGGSERAMEVWQADQAPRSWIPTTASDIELASGLESAPGAESGRGPSPTGGPAAIESEPSDKRRTGAGGEQGSHVGLGSQPEQAPRSSATAAGADQTGGGSAPSWEAVGGHPGRQREILGKCAGATDASFATGGATPEVRERRLTREEKRRRHKNRKKLLVPR
ncbi:MAG: AAA family ATPase [Planctomycetaceae bacterium]